MPRLILSCISAMMCLIFGRSLIKTMIFSRRSAQNRFWYFSCTANLLLWLDLKGFCKIMIFSIWKKFHNGNRGSGKFMWNQLAYTRNLASSDMKITSKIVLNRPKHLLTSSAVNPLLVLAVSGVVVHLGKYLCKNGFCTDFVLHIFRWISTGFFIKSEGISWFSDELQPTVTPLSDGVGWCSNILGLCAPRDTLIPGL